MTAPYVLPDIHAVTLSLVDWLPALADRTGNEAIFVQLTCGEAKLCICFANCKNASAPAAPQSAQYRALRREADRVELAFGGHLRVLFYRFQEGCTQTENQILNSQFRTLMRGLLTHNLPEDTKVERVQQL